MNKTREEVEAKYAKWSKILVFLVIVAGIIIGVGFVQGANWFGWLLAVINIVFGPACLIFYLLEIKHGVFKEEEAED